VVFKRPSASRSRRAHPAAVILGYLAALCKIHDRKAVEVGKSGRKYGASIRQGLPRIMGRTVSKLSFQTI